jgi:hypothetical protein
LPRLPDAFLPTARGRPQGSRRKGPRSRDEVDADRRRLRDDTERELDALVAEFHALLPPDKAAALGAIYARYSSRFQHSVPRGTADPDG